MRLSILVMALLFSLLVPACSSTYRAYSGPKRLPDHISTVVAGDTDPRDRERGWENWSAEMPAALMYTHSYVELYKVDNKIVPEAILWENWKKKRAELLPGRHCIGIAFTREYIFVLSIEREETGHRELCLDLEAGHSYQANHAFSEATEMDYVWVIDKASGQLIAGELPLGRTELE